MKIRVGDVRVVVVEGRTFLVSVREIREDGSVLCNGSPHYGDIELDAEEAAHAFGEE